MIGNDESAYDLLRELESRYRAHPLHYVTLVMTKDGGMLLSSNVEAGNDSDMLAKLLRHFADLMDRGALERERGDH